MLQWGCCSGKSMSAVATSSVSLASSEEPPCEVPKLEPSTKVQLRWVSLVSFSPTCPIAKASEMRAGWECHLGGGTTVLGGKPSLGALPCPGAVCH